MKAIASVKRVENTMSEDLKLFNIEPHYEICDNGMYREIINKSREIPNNGKTFFVNKNVDGSRNNKQMDKATNILDKYNGRLIKVEIDTDNILPNFKDDDFNSCKYGINIHSLNELSSDEIIEIIKINETASIDKIIEQDAKRYMPIDSMPLNNRILLEMGDYIYGCFEYSTAATKNQINDVTQKEIRISACYNSNPANSINKYLKEDLNSLIKTVLIGYKERRFIVDRSELNAIKKVDTLDFIEDKALINLCQRLIKDNKNYNIPNQEIKLIKECIEEIDNDCLEFKDIKLKRLKNIQKRISENEELRKNIINNFFELEEWRKFAEEYLDKNPSKIKEIAQRTELYKESIVQLQSKKNDLENLIEKREKELNELSTREEEIRKNAIEHEKTEINKLKEEHESIQNEYENYKNELCNLKKLVNEYKELSDLKKEVVYQERRKNEIEDHIKQLKKEFKNINAYPKEALDKCLSDEITKDIFREAIFSKNKNEEDEIIEKPKTQKYNNASEIISIFREKFEKAGRDYCEEDIINLIISITQNFITVFAGEPGVGKTSLCRILAKCFGAYEDRFAKVSVERGWTSSKDIIGYYNPITKTIEKSNEDMFKFLRIVDNEEAHGENNLYLALLDEANLSPIEHYWSSFMMLADNCRSNPINIGGENKFNLTDATRFLATINYDHTTENLSDRFLDRAWVILMESSDIESMLNNSVSSDIDNSETLIDFENLKKFFGKKEGELRPHIKNQLVEILKILSSNNVNISRRSRNAIVNYCVVAQEYIDKENDSYLPLDYAIAQKILPMLNGYGDEFKEMLEKLSKVFDNAGLSKCKNITEKMLRAGNREYDYYQFFAR